MSLGHRFQEQVTAWWAARILLQTPGVGRPFRLPDTAVAERLACETSDSIDDIRIDLTDEFSIYGQCKRSLNLTTTLKGDWASVLLQFCEQFIELGSSAADARFVLFYEEPNGNLARLHRLLDRYRTLPATATLRWACTTKEEQTLATNLSDLLTRVLRKARLSLSKQQRAELLHTIYIKQMHLGEGEADYLGVVDAIRDGLLTERAQAIPMVEALATLSEHLMAERLSVDRGALRLRLQNRAVYLRESVDYRRDFHRLQDWSSTSMETHRAEGRVEVAIHPERVTIQRRVTGALIQVASRQSLLLVGRAGVGKTGCLLEFVRSEQASGHHVWYWAADDLPYSSVQELANRLELAHPWKEILLEAASGAGCTMVIDGLDALRSAEAQRAYRDLIALAMRCGVTVAASIRSFDLEHSLELQDRFRLRDKDISADLQLPSLRHVSHIELRELDDQELSQITKSLPAVQQVLNHAPQLCDVVRNLFSLDLLCKLISDGGRLESLFGISSQERLFDEYWRRRVDSHHQRQELKQALESLVEQMVQEKTLRVRQRAWSAAVQDALFSAEIVRRPLPSPGRLPDEELLEFSHHLLFDYAAERLFVRPRRNTLELELASYDSWGLFLRPSILLYFGYAWRMGRIDFWDTVLQLQRSQVPLIYRLPGCQIIADYAETREDLQPLMEYGGVESDIEPWIGVLSLAIAAGKCTSFPRLFGAGSGNWWLEFARDLIRSGTLPFVQAGRDILPFPNTLQTLSVAGLLLINQAAIALLEFYRSEGHPPQIAMRLEIDWLCQSLPSNRAESIGVIRAMFSQEQLERAGFVQAPAVTNHIQQIWEVDYNLAVDIWDAVFAYRETGTSYNVMGGPVFPMKTERKQDYETACWQLSESFPAFLNADPLSATRALIRVVSHWEQQDRSHELQPILWGSRQCRLRPADSSIVPPHLSSGYQVDIHYKWHDFMLALPMHEQAEECWRIIAEVIASENSCLSIWKQLLEIGSLRPEFYCQKLWELLLNPILLLGLATLDVAQKCLKAFASHLAPADVCRLEATIMEAQSDNTDEGEDSYARQQSEEFKKAQLLEVLPPAVLSTAAKELVEKKEKVLSRFYDELRETHAQTGVPFFESEWAAPSHPEVLKLLNSLGQLLPTAITTDNLGNRLAEALQLEHLLKGIGNQLSERLHAIGSETVLSVLRAICSSGVSLSEKQRTTIMERFTQALDAAPPADESDQSIQQPRRKARANAAAGLLCLVIKAVNPSPYVQLLQQTAKDQQDEVRHELGKQLGSLVKALPEFVWKTLEYWIDDTTWSKRLEVLVAGLAAAWDGLQQSDTKRADCLLERLCLIASADGARWLKERCAIWLTERYLEAGVEWCQKRIEEMSGAPDQFSDELQGVRQVLLTRLWPADGDPASTEVERDRAAPLLHRLVYFTVQALRKFASDHPTAISETPNWATEAINLLRFTTARFHFAARRRAEHIKCNETADRETKLEIWWTEAGPLLQTLLDFPQPGLVYSVIEGLGEFATLDSPQVLKWMRQATDASVPWGLTTDSLAANGTIKILERVAACNRALLATHTEVRSDFLSVLETYMQLGWTNAVGLAIQLESIYRQ